MLLRLTCRVVVLSTVMVVPGFAQAAPAAKSAAATPTTSVPAPRSVPAAQAVPTPPRPDDRAGYEPAGRRDPFVSLLSRGETKLPLGGRPIGAKGLLIGELTVRGVMRTNGKLIAIVQAPDHKTYTVHAGDALYDGTVKVVASDAVIFLQRVDDPLSPVKQREIRKTLRTTEENR
jgi:Tfp pilus assembly protein PilP